MTAVCVFCGSSSRVAEPYRRAAARLGEAIAAAGIRLVYGGGRIGLMGILADAALGAGGRVVGVLPEFLRGLEVAHSGLTELRIVPTMHDRKRMMFELADAFVVLPGGFGTVDETIEIVTWRQLGLHDKPVVVVDVGGFWQPLRALIAAIVGEGFAHPEHAKLLTVVSSVEEVLPALRDRPPARVEADPSGRDGIRTTGNPTGARGGDSMSREVAMRYFERLKSRDAKTVAESFHADIVSWDPLAGEVRGKEAVTAVFAGLFQQMPDVSFEPKRYVIEGQSGAVEWVWTGTGPRGKVVIPGMDLMEFAAGTIRSIKFYYDPTPLK